MAKRKVIVDVEANINPFEALASTVKPTAAKDEKVAATVTPEISALVDRILAHKADIARLEAEQKEFEEQVITHIQPQQDDMAYAGDYTNSMTVQGVEKKVLYITSDKFSVAQDEATHIALKQLLGSKYDSIFSKKRVISLKDGMDTNQDFIKALVAALKLANISFADTFTVVDKIIPAKELAENQYKYVKQNDLPQWRSLCKQAKAALKGTK
jgi:hypothetical protein